jgi:spoIIIJ-associated protein
MKDKVFEGQDVAGALAAASHGLGVPAERLRYVVLEPGQPATTAAGARPARVAVLLEAVPEAPPPAALATPAAPAPEKAGARGRVRRMVEAFADALGEPLAVSFEEGEEVVVARLEGPAEAVLLQNDAAALRAFEHLLQRAAGHDEKRRLQVTSARYRAERDAYLRERAHALAAQVAADRVPRETEPLNSYDRRIVHIALQERPGLKSFSVGEGAARRVTIAVADPPATS